METLKDWAARAEQWLATDLALLTHDEGWRACSSRAGIGLWRKKCDDDPNDLFRWRLPTVDAPADVVFEGFVTKILDYHKHWTREFAGGRIVEVLSPDARVIYQSFKPGIPGIAMRDLCSIEVTQRLSPGATLTSFRSVDAVPDVPGQVRIDWWGAALIKALDGGGRCELIYLDRENQGGRVPAWMMNRAMPGYLLLQAEQVQKFFAEGGPTELRRSADLPTRAATS